MAHFATIAHPIENELHPPISRVITLHPLSNPKLEHVSVYFAVTIRERVKGYLERFDFDEIKAKYRA